MATKKSDNEKSPDRNEGFPRTTTLPTQSPLFWTQQKDRYLRQLAIRDIEDITGRRLVVYFANRIENAQIDQKDPALMAELLGDVNDEPVDILLETNGGATDATEALVSLIQNTISDFRVIVANGAKSNGTLLALAAKSIVMGATSELGPIEPLVQNIPCSILIQDQTKQQNFPLYMFGTYALQQTKTLANKLLTDGMMSGRDSTTISTTVEALASRDKFFSHGSVIDHKEATTLGLSVEYLPPDDELWQRVWLLYCMYEFDIRRARLWKVFEGRARSTAVTPPPLPPK